MTEPTRPPLVATFAAERYAATAPLDNLIAPPYDVISAARRGELAARDRHNVVHLILPDGNGDRYARAASILSQWRQEGVLLRDDSAGVYVIRQTFSTPDGRRLRRTGVVAGVHVEPYAAGRVKPHEKTHVGPKEDRLALSRATGAMLESIFMLARDEDGSLVSRLAAVTAGVPTATGSLDGVDIACWRVTGPDAVGIAAAADRGALYIADGHHRFETANAYRVVNPAATHIPTLIVPITDPGLVVLPTHRVVRGRPSDTAGLERRWSEGFAVEQHDGNADPHQLLGALSGRGTACVVVLPDRSLVLIAKDPADEPAIARLERDIVQPMVSEIAEGSLGYTADPAELVALVRGGGAATGVLVGPTPVEQVLAVSDAGGIMPSKSTFFAPKVPSGFVFMAYDSPEEVTV